MRVRFYGFVSVPDGTPIADVEEWLEFCTGVNGSISGNNALIDTDPRQQGIKSISCETVLTPNAAVSGSRPWQQG